ncbi:uncharacterized protein LOC130989870 [Salvia miltiorrhiza]|uniref:uncharacterized protein LOC130989870 n=1 Tax=Salvia miltiorrhiza TaxID=226208 RepID=UPI0025AD3D83|nr:uncharacterized protein LOC130989870 [Salvia miltiorrhiza]
MEYKFLSALLPYVDSGAWDGNARTLSVELARDVINGIRVEFSGGRPYSFYIRKITALRTRFLFFSRLIQDPEVHWDPLHNIMTMSDEVYASYLEVEPIIRGYKEHGEPMFFLLRGIYFVDE